MESRFPKGKLLEQCKEDEVYFVYNSRTKQQMPHDIQFFNDFIQNKLHLDIKSSVKQSEISYLIIHGNKDKTVNIKEAENIHNWAK